MALNERFQELTGLDYALLDSIEDEVIYIGPDNKINWMNTSARNLVCESEGNFCYETLCSRESKCEECLLSGSPVGLCEQNFTAKTEKIVAHYSVGENYSGGVLLVFGDKSKYSNGLKSDVKAIEDESRLFHEANHDQLTSLYNRRYMDYLFNLIDNNKRKETNNHYALTILDIDKFKSINDTYGHSVGDEVLKVFAYRIISEIRKTDIAIRMGGDEFLIVHSQNKEQDILGFIKRLVNHMNKPILLEDGRVLKITLSMGILLNAQSYGHLKNAMKYADHALYEAKSRSSTVSNYVFFGKDLEKEISYTRELAEDLDEAISHNEFSVYYQPIISLTTDKICGMEAFARWFSSEGDKRYSPTQFLPIAESRNTIIELGEQLINQVFEDIKRYRKQINRYDFLSVNFTERQLMTKEYISLISDLARASKFDIKKLHIELTEDALIKNKSAAKRMVNKYREAGIEIILDNFGKGYSSLSYLLEYDIKKIKIDRRVISQIDKSEHCLKLMKTIMSIAQIHDIEVIAKGVENCEQLDIVRDLGCQYAQGYFVCVPMAIGKYFKFAKDYYMEKNQLSLLTPDSVPVNSIQGFFTLIYKKSSLPIQIYPARQYIRFLKYYFLVTYVLIKY